MSHTDDWFICKKCGKEFERWGELRVSEQGRCLDCSSPAMRRKYGGKAKKKNCLLCGVEYEVPMNVGASTKYCLEHRGMDTHERKRAFAIRDGLPVPQQRFARKVSVDRTVYVNVNHLFSNRSIEKIVKTLQDKNVRLVR